MVLSSKDITDDWVLAFSGGCGAGRVRKSKEAEQENEYAMWLQRQCPHRRLVTEGLLDAGPTTAVETVRGEAVVLRWKRGGVCEAEMSGAFATMLRDTLWFKEGGRQRRWPRPAVVDPVCEDLRSADEVVLVPLGLEQHSALLLRQCSPRA
jgi:hypothetical protein